jgi:hypothetical protein
MLRDRLTPLLALFVIFGFTGSLLAQSATKASPQEPAPSLLPADFGGWHLASPQRPSTQPQAADDTNAEVLSEDGFTQFSAGTYTRGDGTLKVRAIRFQDATGAYAAYTFYRRAGMLKEDVGEGAAWDGSRLLFWQGPVLVDATFDHVNAMSAAELRELASMLPPASGSAAVAPLLPRYLPPESLQPLTTRYALGPVGYARSGGVLPPALVDFARGAEALTAQYADRDGEGTLTVINYPTPQLAADRQKAIDAFLKAGNSSAAAWPPALAQSSVTALLSRRSGPLVVVTSGSFPSGVARKLIGQVNYSADVTWNNPRGYFSEASKTARLLLGIAMLTGVLCGAAVIIGIFLGGGRAAYRWIRGKPVSTLQESEFISLHLE